MRRTHMMAQTGPTNAQMKPRSVDSQQLQKSQNTVEVDMQ